MCRFAGIGFYALRSRFGISNLYPTFSVHNSIKVFEEGFGEGLFSKSPSPRT
jgi:hypothetical protein